MIVWLGGAAIALALARRFGEAPAAAALLLAVVAGLTLPDIDRALGLGHRSALTHGPLPWLVALGRREWRPVAAGLAIGIGFHLAADAFPNAMTGYARVRLPAAGTLGAGGSYAWLGVWSLLSSAAGAVLLALRFRGRLGTALLLAAPVIGAGYLLRTEGGWWALIAYAGGFVALRFRRIGPR